MPASTDSVITVKGRVDEGRSTFVHSYDPTTGIIRIDSPEKPGFWMEINVSGAVGNTQTRAQQERNRSLEEALHCTQQQMLQTQTTIKQALRELDQDFENMHDLEIKDPEPKTSLKRDSSSASDVQGPDQKRKRDV